MFTSIDGILPPPKTNLEAFQRWQNRMASELATLPWTRRRRIPIKSFTLDDFRSTGCTFIDGNGDYITKEEAQDIVDFMNQRT